MEYPFTKKLEWPIPLDQLDMPKWTGSVKDIISDLNGNFETAQVDTSFHTFSISRPEVIHGAQSPTATLSNPQPLQGKPGICEFEKRRMNCKLILEYRKYFSSIAETLDMIPQNEEEQSTLQLLTTNLNAIQSLKNELLSIVALIDRELLEYSTRHDSSLA